MRASTVFALALALLIGLAAAAGAKYAGLFERKPPAAAPQPAPPYKILVSKTNIFEDTTVTFQQVMVKELGPEDQEQMRTIHGEKWKDKLLPGLPAAAHLLVAKQNILADTPLFKSYFADQVLPDELSKRLDPNMRAVNVSISKEKAVGGVLRVGEHVDVFLTTEIGFAKDKELRTACIARGCKIIMKRNTPYSIVAFDPDDKPLAFTLEANPYRAMLIDYAQQHGQLSLLPTSTPSKTAGTGSFADATSAEYATEDARVEKVNQGTLAVGDKDLVRIFNIVPPPPKPVTPPPTVIQHLAGVKDAGYTIIPHGGHVYFPTAPPSSSDVRPAGGIGGMGAAGPNDNVEPAGYTFKLPSATGNSGCKSCDEAKKKAASAQ